MIEQARNAHEPRLAYASFPWYDLPEMHHATDALWQALRATLVANGVGDVPDRLDRIREHGTDRDGACFFTQTCGLPLFTTARGHFTVVGAPAYRVPGCVGAQHRSYIVVRSGADATALGDLRGARFAINERDSNSGMNLPRRLFAPLAREGRFFASTIVTGSHAASAAAVTAGEADVAAIDCVTFALLGRYRPAAIAELRVVAETTMTPTPPLVTSRFTARHEVAAIRFALRDVFANAKHAALRDALFLSEVEFCDGRAYRVVMRFEDEARELGYATLA